MSFLRIRRDRNVPTAQTELPQFVLQRLPVHAQDLSCPSHVSLSVFEATSDVTTFKFSPVLAKVCCEGYSQSPFAFSRFRLLLDWTGSDLLWEIARAHFIALSHYPRAIDRFLQLAYIPGPVILN